MKAVKKWPLVLLGLALALGAFTTAFAFQSQTNLDRFINLSSTNANGGSKFVMNGMVDGTEFFGCFPHNICNLGSIYFEFDTGACTVFFGGAA